MTSDDRPKYTMPLVNPRVILSDFLVCHKISTCTRLLLPPTHYALCRATPVASFPSAAYMHRYEPPKHKSILPPPDIVTTRAYIYDIYDYVVARKMHLHYGNYCSAVLPGRSFVPYSIKPQAFNKTQSSCFLIHIFKSIKTF